MVGRSYLLDKPSGPSRPKVLLDQWLIPRAIDAAGACEVAVERISLRTGLRPAVLLAAAGAGIAVTTLILLRRPRPAVSTRGF